MTPGKSSLPASLQRLIDAIEDESNIDSGRLMHHIQEAGLMKADLLALSNFDHPAGESYGRNRIYEGVNFSIYLMSWAKGDFTGIHSHGLTEWGAVSFFGVMDHRLYKLDDNKIVLADKGTVPLGAVVPVSGDLIHAMGNINREPVMSLHIYGWKKSGSNPSDNSQLFELEKKQVRTTNGSAFLNIKADLCSGTTAGISTDIETISDYFTLIRPFYKRNDNTEMVKYLDRVISDPRVYFS